MIEGCGEFRRARDKGDWGLGYTRPVKVLGVYNWQGDCRLILGNLEGLLTQSGGGVACHAHTPWLCLFQSFNRQKTY